MERHPDEIFFTKRTYRNRPCFYNRATSRTLRTRTQIYKLGSSSVCPVLGQAVRGTRFVSADERFFPERT